MYKKSVFIGLFAALFVNTPAAHAGKKHVCEEAADHMPSIPIAFEKYLPEKTYAAAIHPKNGRLAIFSSSTIEDGSSLWPYGNMFLDHHHGKRLEWLPTGLLLGTSSTGPTVVIHPERGFIVSSDKNLKLLDRSSNGQLLLFRERGDSSLDGALKWQSFKGLNRQSGLMALRDEVGNLITANDAMLLEKGPNRYVLLLKYDAAVSMLAIEHRLKAYDLVVAANGSELKAQAIQVPRALSRFDQVEFKTSADQSVGLVIDRGRREDLLITDTSLRSKLLSTRDLTDEEVVLWQASPFVFWTGDKPMVAMITSVIGKDEAQLRLVYSNGRPLVTTSFALDGTLGQLTVSRDGRNFAWVMDNTVMVGTLRDGKLDVQSLGSRGEDQGVSSLRFSSNSKILEAVWETGEKGGYHLVAWKMPK